MRALAPTDPPTEAAEQRALIEWWRVYAPSRGIDARLLIHIPNEGLRSYRTATHLRSQGMVAGTPDLFLAVPVGPLSGLWIEMKRATRSARVSAQQVEMIHLLFAQGYGAVVCHGAEAAIETITTYLADLQ